MPTERYIVKATGVYFISATRSDGKKKLPTPETLEFRVLARSREQAADNVAAYLEWEDFIFESLSVEGPILDPNIGPWG